MAIRTIHGHAKGTKSPEYHSWHAMLSRCRNANDPSYPHYGGRGIAVCDRWFTFPNFLADMGPRPANTSLNRLNNELGYGPQNCEWSDIRSQIRNRRITRTLTARGQTKTLAGWCDETGLLYSTIRARIARGWPADQVLSPRGWWKNQVSTGVRDDAPRQCKAGSGGLE